jgi:hypothetical protein
MSAFGSNAAAGSKSVFGRAGMSGVFAAGVALSLGSAVTAQVPRGTPAPKAATTLAPDAGRLPAEKRYLPAAINEPLMSMAIQVIKEAPGECVYRSRHFEFTTPVKLGAGSMKEICRSFESTYELICKLPWGINPWPEDGRFFRAQLFPTREEYRASGAPEWSAGAYSLKDRVFRIPFEEVGLKNRGSEYFLGGVINNDTITHEVTHQMMHEYLRFMPIWMTEGLAEYTSNLPYTSGRYSVAAALEGFKQMRRDYGKVKRRGLTVRTSRAPQWVGAAQLWEYTTSILIARPISNSARTPPEKPRPVVAGTFPPLSGGVSQATSDQTNILDLPNRYFSGHALVFYFMHFDGDGKGTRLKKFFDLIHEERKLWAGFGESLATYEKAVEKYLGEWEEFKKNPGVIDLGGGMIRYPNNLRPPAEPPAPATPGNTDATKVCVKHLGILLDGRTPAELDAQVRAAFLKAQVPL